MHVKFRRATKNKSGAWVKRSHARSHMYGLNGICSRILLFGLAWDTFLAYENNDGLNDTRLECRTIKKINGWSRGEDKKGKKSFDVRVKGRASPRILEDNSFTFDQKSRFTSKKKLCTRRILSYARIKRIGKNLRGKDSREDMRMKKRTRKVHVSYALERFMWGRMTEKKDAHWRFWHVRDVTPCN